MIHKDTRDTKNATHLVLHETIYWVGNIDVPDKKQLYCAWNRMTGYHYMQFMQILNANILYK